MLRDQPTRFERSDIFFVEDAAGHRLLSPSGRWAIGAFFVGLMLGYFGSRLLF